MIGCLLLPQNGGGGGSGGGGIVKNWIVVEDLFICIKLGPVPPSGRRT